VIEVAPEASVQECSRTRTAGHCAGQHTCPWGLYQKSRRQTHTQTDMATLYIYRRSSCTQPS